MPAVDMFIKIDGIPGESPDAKHKDEIQVESWSWGVANTGNMGVGSGGGAGKGTSSDLTFNHYLDKASPILFLSCISGKHIPTAQLTLRKAGEKAQEYFTMKLTDLLVTNVQVGGNGADLKGPVESVSLNFTKYEVDYKTQDAKGQLGAGAKSGWNLKQNVKV
jgi:type VI secretion system secreted protein Hcp